MNFKRWSAIVMTALALVACGSPVVEPVARVDNVVLSRQDLDQRIDRRVKWQQDNAQQVQQLSELDIERQIVERFIDQNLVLGLARQQGITINDTEVDALIERFRTSVAQSGGTDFEQVIQGELGMPGSQSTEFRQFVSSFVAQQKLGATLVTTDTVRQQMLEQMSEKVEQVHSAHILFSVEAEEDAPAAEAKAKETIARLANGEKFEDLAKELSQDPGSAANGGDLGWFGRGRLVPEFEQAIFEDLQPGETTQEPVRTQFGYHIIKVIERAERAMYSEEEANQLIEQNLGQELENQRFQAVQELIQKERADAKAAGRLIEPTYPEPTPVPAEAPPAAPAQEPTAAPETTGEPTPAP